MYEHLLYEVNDGIATVTVNNPKTLNALNFDTLSELKTAFTEAMNAEDVYAVIVTGGGEKAFVAGADISEMVNASPEEGRAMALLADEAFTLLEEMPKPTIAAVNGYALGGGCELAMACDIRIASEKAVFGQPEVGLGIIPGFGGTQRLARLVGKGRAKELIFTTDKIKADEAYRIGLANKVVAPEELMDAAKAMVGRILKNGKFAVAIAKGCIEMGEDIDLHNGLLKEAGDFGLTFATADKQEGMEAFLQKRPANFK